MSIFNQHQSAVDEWFEKWQSGLKVTRDQIHMRYELLMRLVWGATPGLTLDQKFQKIGTNAVAIFTLAGTLKSLLATADPTLLLTQVPDTYNWEGGIVFHEDGSATLNPRPEPEEEPPVEPAAPTP